MAEFKLMLREVGEVAGPSSDYFTTGNYEYILYFITTVIVKHSHFCIGIG